VSPTVVVHHLETSRSTRILWALEELGVQYEIKTYTRHPKTFRAGPEIKAVHPVGRFPVLSIDDVVLAESGAILEHLAELHGRLAPTADADRLQYRYWMHFAEGSLMPPLLVAVITGRLRTAVPFPVNVVSGAIGKTIDKQYTWPQLADLLTAVDAHLTTHPYFAGSAFTMADIQMSYPCLAALNRIPPSRGSYDALRAWATTVQDRSAFSRAVELGGPLFPG